MALLFYTERSSKKQFSEIRGHTCHRLVQLSFMATFVMALWRQGKEHKDENDFVREM